MTTRLIMLEPADDAGWAPFAGVRPVAELRAGAWRVRERWERALGLRATEIIGGAAAGFHELDSPRVAGAGTVSGPAIAAASWFAPQAGALAFPPGTRRLTHAGQTVACIAAAGERVDLLSDDGAAHEVGGVVLGGAHRLLDALETLLQGDCASERDATAAQSGGATPALPDGTIVLGDRREIVSFGAAIEPGVVFDVRAGGVVLERGVEVRSGTRLEGPCWIGAGTRMLGGYVRASAFGPRCVVRGEVAASVFTGYANKGHDGFVGHSVLGQWVNLGAGTTTSNLKNTYGPIRLDTGHGKIETNRMYLGSLIGDHAKTAIGTMLSTGTVIGAGASVFGAGGVPKYVAPFSWGMDGERVSEDGFLRIAARVMPRRDVELTPERAASLSATYRRLAAP